MKKIIIIYTVFALMLIVSCASVGKKFNSEVVRDNVKVGLTTKSEVLQICGEPLSKKLCNGVEVWNYSYIKKNVTPLGVVTNQLGIGTEWKSHREIMDISFKDGVVEDIKLDSGTQTKMHY